MEWSHGGDVWTFEQESGYPPLDFSASISPLGLPEGVKRAAMQALERSGAYPDPFCRGLREALAKRLDLEKEYILCGNGALDLIYRLCAATALSVRQRDPSGKAAELSRARTFYGFPSACPTAIVTAPAFSEYELALGQNGFDVRRFPLKEANGFVLTDDILDWIIPGTEMIFVCQPNNPTGRTVDRVLLGRILQRCDECGTLLVADECFADFLDEPDRYTLMSMLRGHRLLILRSFTKLYAMAGLRLGCCFCQDTALLGAMAAAGPCWQVSDVAQAAGIAALQETEYVRQVRREIRLQRKALAEGLRACGLRVVPGEANYLLFYCGVPGLGESLRQKGILLRDCRDYHGLGPGWYRTAVRTRKDNDVLLRSIREVRQIGG